MADEQEREIEKQFERARRMRNIAIALALGGLVVLFFVMTMVRLKGHVVELFQ
jgi:hypothetical protein